MEVRLTRTDCDKAGDYVVPNVLSPRDLVSRPDNTDKIVLHTLSLASLHKSDAVVSKVMRLFLSPPTALGPLEPC